MALIQPGLPWLRKLAGALLSPGRYEPARPARTTSSGATTPAVPEVVEPKGVLRSKTVWTCIVLIFFSIADARGWNLGFTQEQAEAWFPTIEAGLATLAGWFRITAWMPTRGPTMGAP